MLKWSSKARSGFTLIELLVVVVIIGILASVGVQGLSAAQDKARNSAVMSNTRSIIMAIENWKADHQGVPAQLLGADHTTALASSSIPASTASFPVPYCPGNLLPMSPWARVPQTAMDPTYANVTDVVGNCPIAPIKDLFEAGDPKLTAGTNIFQDGANVTGTVPPAGSGPSLRSHYGFIYYFGDINTGRFAVFGVGKAKNSVSADTKGNNGAQVIAVRGNFF